MPTTNIIDNLYHGNVRDFYTAALVAGSDASFCSAFFTIHAYAELQKQLEGLKRLRFLFGEPTFIKKMNEKTMQQNFHITDENIVPAKSLQQQSIAKECSEFLRQKAEIRSIVKPNYLHGKLYHIIQPNEVQKTLIGSSNFTVNGLGVGTQHNIELNLIVDSNRSGIIFPMRSKFWRCFNFCVSAKTNPAKSYVCFFSRKRIRVKTWMCMTTFCKVHWQASMKRSLTAMCRI